MQDLKSRLNALRGVNNNIDNPGARTPVNNPVVDLTGTDMPPPAGRLAVQAPSQVTSSLTPAASFLVTSAFQSTNEPVSDNQLLNWSFTMWPHRIGSDDLVMDVMNRIGEDSKWAIFGQEVCPTTGEVHLQCFCILKTRVRLSQLRKKYHQSIHWEGSKGTPSQNWDYCTKEDKSPWEFGKRPEFDTNGEREKNRWDVARIALTEGRLDDVDSQIFISFYRSCKAIVNDSLKVDKLLTAYPGEWLYGVPGSGKSWEARMLQDSKPYVKKADKWWCNYNFEKIVVIEDLSPDHSWMINFLKVWTDVYPFPAEVKQGNLPMIRPEKIIVTSNYSMAECFAGVDERSVDIKAIMRRFKRKYFPCAYKGDGQPTAFLVTEEDEDEILRVKPPSIPKTDGFVTPNFNKVGVVLETPADAFQGKGIPPKRGRVIMEDEDEAEEEVPPGLPIRRSTTGMFNLAPK